MDTGDLAAASGVTDVTIRNRTKELREENRFLFHLKIVQLLAE
jgi:transcription initiation factor TFIIIB Brf1 subunit/transcription initiation factor TFIIB